MTDGDLVEVSELLQCCFNWLAEREGFTEQQREFLAGPRSSVQTLREESQTRPHYVARTPDGAVMGVAAICANELARLYVDPKYHSQGVGKALFREAESLFRKSGYAEMTVAALVDSAAGFYRAQGMHDIGRAPYEPELFKGRELFLLAKSIIGETSASIE